MKKSAPVRSYLGLGSNLSDPESQLHRAVAALSALPDSTFVTVSSFYHTAPMGPQDQPHFVNAVAALDTCLSPEDLLCALQRIEQAQGRVRNQETVRWGPRTLDIDILLYGTLHIISETLQIPHPGLTERDFVLRPLLEIAPNLVLPS